MLGKPCWSSFEMYPISGYFSKLGAHLTMLSDRRRVEFYEKALQEAIVPGESIVLDIGTGTGILAMLAARNGAKKVYAVECGDIINIAKIIVLRNGLVDKIDFVKGLSTEIILPEKVDIIVSETMGFTGLEENIEEIMRDAKKRFGHKNTQLIPSKLNVYVALSDDRTTREKLVDVWNEDYFGFDYKFLAELSKQNVFTRQKIDEVNIKSNIGVIAELTLDGKREGGVAELVANDDCKLEGFTGWFSVEASSGMSLYDKNLTYDGHWQQFFVNFPEAVDAKKLDIFRVKLFEQQPFIWEVSHIRNGKTINCFRIDNGEIIKSLKRED